MKKLKKILLGLLILAAIIIAAILGIKNVYGESGENFDYDAPVTATFAHPSFSNVHFSKSSVSYDLTASLIYGSTTTHPVNGTTVYWYQGWTKVWLENPAGGGGEICLGEGPNYLLKVDGDAPQSDSTSGSIDYDLSDLIDMDVSDPSSSSGFRRNSSTSGYVYASASDGKMQGTAELELDVYLEDWSGPADDTVWPNLADTKRILYEEKTGTVSVTDTDPIDHYYYTVNYDPDEYKVSRGNYGSGSSFRESVDVSDAGKYYHVTFYTESGNYVNETIAVPDAATLSYNGNGNTSGSVPSSQTKWAGYSFTTARNSMAKTNCEFLGWSTTKYDVLGYQKTINNLITQGSSFTPYRDTTLYAVWRTVKMPYEVKLTLNGKDISSANNDFALITGYVNGGASVTNSRVFDALEIPGYTVSASIKASDSNVFIIDSANTSKSSSFVKQIAYLDVDAFAYKLLNQFGAVT